MHHRRRLGSAAAGSAMRTFASSTMVAAPSTTSPNAAYWPSSRAVPSRESPMNHWLPAESGSSSRAIEITPKSCGRRVGSNGIV